MGTQISFSCPHCRTSLTVPAELAGVSGPCPTCGLTITSPTPEAPAAAATPAPAVTAGGAPPASPLPGGRNPAPEPARSAEPPVPRPSPPSPARAPWQGQESVNVQPHSLRPSPPHDDRIPRERVAKGSPWTAVGLALFLATFLGAAGWFVYQHYLQQGDTGTPPGGGLPDPAPMGSNPSPIVPPPTPAIPSPPAPPPALPPEDTTPAPEPPKPGPTPAPLPENPSPRKAPEDPPVVPGPVDPGEVVRHRPNDSLLPLPEETMVREFQDRMTSFLKAKDPQDRLPMLYSETQGTEALGEMLRKGALSKIPPMEYKTVIAYEGPRQGIIQYYVAATNQAAGSEDDNRELLLHFANHGGAGFRVNADVLAMQIQNQLRVFADDPAAAPLRASVFIERAHFFSSDSDTPRGHLCINLRYGPFTPVICQAFVDEGSPPGADLVPLASWGDAPKAVVVVLKHKPVGGHPAIFVDQFVCSNWLQVFPKAPPPN